VFLKFTQTYRRQQTLVKALHTFTDKVIVARREKLLEGNVAIKNDDEGFGTKTKKTFAAIDN
jgi:hypothetical protein